MVVVTGAAVVEVDVDVDVEVEVEGGVDVDVEVRAGVDVDVVVEEIVAALTTASGLGELCDASPTPTAAMSTDMARTRRLRKRSWFMKK